MRGTRSRGQRPITLKRMFLPLQFSKTPGPPFIVNKPHRLHRTMVCPVILFQARRLRTLRLLHRLRHLSRRTPRPPLLTHR